MTGKLKKYFALALLFVFLFPTIIKLGHHHHEGFVCKAKTEKHFHTTHENCTICTFEFSLFSTNYNPISFAKEHVTITFNNSYTSINFSDLSDYSFLLRAPPAQYM